MVTAALVREGLPRGLPAGRRVIVVGAGMAGLVAAYELLRAGHDPLILEARARVGGRVETLREPFHAGLYAEAGAMRIPRAHDLTLAYVERFALPVRPFASRCGASFHHLHGARVQRSVFERDPDTLGFETAPRERGRTAGELLHEALEPLVARLREGGEQAWAGVVARYDRHTVRGFLEEAGWSEGAIEMFGLTHYQETLLNSSFLEFFREEAGGYFGDLVQIEGGMDQLPRAFLPALGSRIRFGARVVALEQDADGVTVHYRTPAGRFSERAERAIVTLPFSVLRHVEAFPAFSRDKQRAMRQLLYDSATKIFLQCRTRFWEEEGITGGWTATDLPVRNLFYPEHGRATGRGVLLASYTRGQDALRWSTLPERERVEQAVENVAEIFPRLLREVEVGVSKSWQDDEFAGGAFALFEPGQQGRLHPHIVAPEGRYHFAGEHTSLAHAWIQGAVESGLRAALEVHCAGAERLPETLAAA